MSDFCALQQMRDVMHIGGHDRRGTQRYRNRDGVAIDNCGGLREREQCSHLPRALLVQSGKASTEPNK
jgi:hypothetical protein